MQLTKINCYKMPCLGLVITCKIEKRFSNRLIIFNLKRVNSAIVNVLELNKHYEVVSTNRYMIAQFLLDEDALTTSVRKVKNKIIEINT